MQSNSLLKPQYLTFRGTLNTWMTVMIENCLQQNNVDTKTFQMSIARPICTYENYPNPIPLPRSASRSLKQFSRICCGRNIEIAVRFEFLRNSVRFLYIAHGWYASPCIGIRMFSNGFHELFETYCLPFISWVGDIKGDIYAGSFFQGIIEQDKKCT